jgi:DNA-binding transcriptional MocR family regulator
VSKRPSRRLGSREVTDLLGDWSRPGTPTYRALAERLRLLVLDGRLPVHAVLPSERSLALDTGTSRTTTTAAYRLLREQGFALAEHGAGTWTAIPRGHAGPTSPVLWPILCGSLGSSDGRGDLTCAALEAPPQIHAAYVAALDDLPRYLPGHGYFSGGLPELRERVAARYTARGLPTAVDEVMITSGAIRGLRTALSLLARPGSRVLVEDPTYPMALDVMRESGLRPVGFAVEEGWDLDQAGQVLRRPGCDVAFLMPDFHNPTGQLMDSTNRQALADRCAAAGCTIVVDETLCEIDLRGFLGDGGRVPPPLPAYCGGRTTICLGSASKTFWGGLRLGWIRAPRSSVRTLLVSRSADELTCPLLEQLAVAHLLDELPTLRHRRQELLSTRFTALRDALSAQLPDWQVPTPQGGIVSWVRLPEPRSSELAISAREVGLVLAPGARFGVRGGFEGRVRLPFARGEEQLRGAVSLLARAWNSTAAPEDPQLPVAVL